MVKFVIAQIAGLVAVACFIVSFQIKSNRALFLTQGLGNAMFCVQFILLGAFSGCYIEFVAIIRNIMLMKFNDWKWVRWKGWVAIFSVLGIGAVAYTWTGFESLLPLLALVASNVVMWKNNAGAIRVGNLVCISPAWLVYDIVVGAYAGVLNEVFVLSSIIISIFRFGWASLFSPESEFQK